MHLILRGEGGRNMQAEVSRGYLDYRDEKGSYSVPIGRRSRKCLIILDKKEGEYVRSLEIDLFTGYVYYNVDNETSGGLSYYYDMSSKKVGHYFIHRYLRLARNHGLVVTPLESEIFEKLPCENWREELERLPGWKEVIDNRIRDLLLPWKEVVKISLPRLAAADIVKETAEKNRISSISFIQSPAAYPGGAREYVYLFEEREGKTVLRHKDTTAGNEFFRQNEEYERILSEEEYAWTAWLAAPFCALPVHQPAEDPLSTPEKASDLFKALLSGKEEMVIREITVRRQNAADPVRTVFDRASAKTNDAPVSGTAVSVDAATAGRAYLLQNLLRGLMRREIELV